MNTKGYHVRNKDSTEYSWFGILFCVLVSNGSEKVEQERMRRINSVFFVLFSLLQDFGTKIIL